MSGLILYTSEDGASRIQLRADGQTVWLTQAEMAELFDVTPDNISLHLKNIFSDKELEPERTTEESSVVGLIDSTPAKQQEDSSNADGDEVLVIDIEASLHAQTEAMKRLLESQPLSPELAALGRELVRLAEKSLGEEVE